jgi:hypothetical protein
MNTGTLPVSFQSTTPLPGLWFRSGCLNVLHVCAIVERFNKSFVGPFNDGTNVKYVQVPGTKMNKHKPGSGVVDWKLTGVYGVIPTGKTSPLLRAYVRVVVAPGQLSVTRTMYVTTALLHSPGAGFTPGRCSSEAPCPQQSRLKRCCFS